MSQIHLTNNSAILNRLHISMCVWPFALNYLFLLYKIIKIEKKISRIVPIKLWKYFKIDMQLYICSKTIKFYDENVSKNLGSRNSDI